MKAYDITSRQLILVMKKAKNFKEDRPEILPIIFHWILVPAITFLILSLVLI